MACKVRLDVPEAISSFCQFLPQLAFIFTIVTYKLPVYDGYVYPPEANVIGFIISVIPLLPIPFFMVKELLSHQGSFVHVSLCVCVCVCVCVRARARVRARLRMFVDW